MTTCPKCNSANVRGYGIKRYADGATARRHKCNDCGRVSTESARKGNVRLRPATDKAIRDALARGVKMRDVAKRYKVSLATVYARTEAGIANQAKRDALKREMRREDLHHASDGRGPTAAAFRRALTPLLEDDWARQWQQRVREFMAQGLDRDTAEERATVEASRRLTA